MRLKLQSIWKNGLIIVAGAAVVFLLTFEVAVAVIAIKFFAIFAAAPPPASSVRDEVAVRAVAFEAAKTGLGDQLVESVDLLPC